MNQVPEVLISHRVYRDGVDMLGIADVELPDLEPLTEKIKGAGIAGEVETPVLGHYGSMTLKLSWRTLVASVAYLAQQKTHHLEIRGASQVYNAGSGEYEVVPIKVVVRGNPKKTGLGKFDVGAKTDSSSELEVVYLKVIINNIDVIEIDKYNYICKVNGENVLSAVSEALGLI